MKSIDVLPRISSMRLSLYTEAVHLSPAIEQIEDNLRPDQRRKQINRDPQAQGHSKSFDRTRAKEKERKARNQRGDVGVKDRQEGLVISRIHGRPDRLACPQLLANPLKHQDVRIHSH